MREARDGRGLIANYIFVTCLSSVYYSSHLWYIFAHSTPGQACPTSPRIPFAAIILNTNMAADTRLSRVILPLSTWTDDQSEAAILRGSQ